MSNLFSISTSALQAFQTAIEVTSNNIANANTPGYAEESVDLAAGVPQADGVNDVGSGVVVQSVNRAYSQLAESQLTSSQSSLSQLNSLQSYTNQIDDIIGTTAGGVSTALGDYYNAWSTLASDPTSTPARQALLSQAQGLAQSLQSTAGQLQSLNSQINAGITADVAQINSDAQSIATLNQQIEIGNAQAGGQAPNTLLDQRDSLIQSLSQIVGVTTTTEPSGAVNVFIGTGQPLVLQGSVTQLTTVPNQFNGSQLEVSTSTDGTNPISSSITSGDLGGLLAARSQAVDPTLNQIGQLALGLANSANSQQTSGLDANGALGSDLFSVAGPVATASSNNTDATTASVTLNDVGALTTDNYVLRYANGAYSLSNASTGATVAFTGNGTAGNPITADGLSIVLSGTPASGDEFLIQPTANAAASFSVALSDPAQLAAAGALQTSAAVGNTGSGAIGAATIVTPTNASLLSTVNIAFTSPTAYTINGQSYAYSPGAAIDYNGWQVTISGTPAAGDQFTVQAGASGNNTNALALAAQQSLGVLSGGTTSIEGAASALITSVGSQAQQVNTAQTAQTAVNSQAQQNVQSISGVNLDDEAANLLQWQQAYQASAQAFTIGSSTFTTLLDSINGTYT